MSHPILMVFNPIFCYVSPKIVIFQVLLIIETWNKCHWIWHALNPKYVPLKQFWCIFSSQNQQMWTFCLKLWFFRNCLSQGLKTCHIGFGMTLTLNIHHSSHFDALFPVKINKIWNFVYFLDSPWQTTKNKMSICTGKKCLKRFANLHT